MSREYLTEHETGKALVLGGVSEDVHMEGSSFAYTSKLLTLLDMTWESPVFGNAYPFSNSPNREQVLHTTFKNIKKMHALLVQWLKPILLSLIHI